MTSTDKQTALALSIIAELFNYCEKVEGYNGSAPHSRRRRDLDYLSRSTYKLIELYRTKSFPDEALKAATRICDSVEAQINEAIR